jgi:hypothetical protein
MKQYIAKSALSINVVDEAGNNIHVAFTPRATGGSVFYTADEKLQAAIERHYKFGKQISVVELPSTSKKQPAAKATKVADEATTDNEETAENTGDAPEPETDENTGDAPEPETDEATTAELRVVKVTDVGAAQEYLANTYGISRSKLRSVAAIKKTAEANGITFEGI